jgi:hypothetical protein
MSWTWPGSASDVQIGRPAGEHDGLDVAAGLVVLAGVPCVDFLALDAGNLLGEAVGGEQLAVQDHEGDAFLPGSLQGLVQARGPGGQDLGPLIDVPVGGGTGDAVVAAELVDAVRSRNRRRTRIACSRQVRARLPAGVPRSRRSAISRRVTKRSSSAGTSSVARYLINGESSG